MKEWCNAAKHLPWFPRILCSMQGMLASSQITVHAETRSTANRSLFLLYQAHVNFAWNLVMHPSLARKHAFNFLYSVHTGQGPGSFYPSTLWASWSHMTTLAMEWIHWTWGPLCCKGLHLCTLALVLL